MREFVCGYDALIPLSTQYAFNTQQEALSPAARAVGLCWRHSGGPVSGIGAVSGTDVVSGLLDRLFLCHRKSLRMGACLTISKIRRDIIIASHSLLIRIPISPFSSPPPHSFHYRSPSHFSYHVSSYVVIVATVLHATSHRFYFMLSLS